jgi:hypothetical protein
MKVSAWGAIGALSVGASVSATADMRKNRRYHHRIFWNSANLMHTIESRFTLQTGDLYYNKIEVIVWRKRSE